MESIIKKTFPIKNKTGLLLRLTASWLLARFVLLWTDRSLPFDLLSSVKYVNGLTLSLYMSAFFILMCLIKGKLHKDADVFLFLYSLHLFSFLSLIRYRNAYFAAGVLLLNLLLLYALMPLIKKAERVLGFKIFLFVTGFPVAIYSTVLLITTGSGSKTLQYTVLLAAIVLFTACLFAWALKRIKKEKPDFVLPVKRFTVIAVVLYAISLCSILVIRTVGLKTPTYDFGIFAQMFYYMKETGRPLTTLERNGLLSHFHIHLSPVFYLMLPFYAIWPDPVILQIAQVLTVLSGVIPLVLLAGELKVPKGLIPILTVIYVFNPGLTGGMMYDLHENCFLAPLLLWVLFGLHKENSRFTLIFSFLTLCVKEDAAVYLACIGLYAVFSDGSKKKRITGAILFALSLLWFTGALLYLDKFGQGPMIDRYKNMMPDPSLGLLGIFVTIFYNPGYILKEIFMQDKLIYMITMILPLGFMPFLNRKISYWFLVVPFVVVNLMTAYPYQYNIGFQYHFGSGALLIYAAMLYLKENVSLQRGSIWRNHGLSLPIFIALIGSLVFGLNIVSNRLPLVINFVENVKQTETIKNALDVIPEDASVQATTLLTTYLSHRDELYDIKYNQKDEEPYETDYAVFDLRGNEERDYQTIIEDLKNQGYDVFLYVHDHVMILQNPDCKKQDM